MSLHGQEMHFSPEELERYSRQILLPQVGAAGQARLRNASVLVIGAGGLGAPLLGQLAGAGIGQLGIVDPDEVSLSNLHRQTLYSMDDIGRPKVAAAEQRLRQINPLVSVSTWQAQASPEQLASLLGPDSPHSWTVVCDGTDNATARVAISDACLRYGVPLVSGSAQGFSGQLIVFHNQAGSPCYRCLYPEVEEAPVTGCAAAGVMGAVTSVMAGFMALEVYRLIIGTGDRTHEPATEIMLWEGLDGSIRRFPLTKVPTCRGPHGRVLKSEA
ncbi:HesA/MoeB/ThiF family protein [Oecophyllibacter saccharovorans]|uniref:HesA/MoeB/ThiF family protein n=1 Tax=Oecophyllibacter saccharovorans TaxID=2558360 RepID=UPI001E552198|nr:HesA/MoeB/ThiF family protein [Oecophyllibacter saccharovorans]